MTNFSPDPSSIAVGVLVGLVVGTVWNTISTYLRSRTDFKERQLLINKLLAGGDAAQNYNLNLTDQVSTSTQAVQAAVQTEVRQRQGVEEEAPKPWDQHPLYHGCDVTFDEESDTVLIFDPNAVDGPDCWEEKTEVFWAQIENPLTSGS